jgi:hypothetical protein
MSRHWDAPRTAYELAADWTERLRDLTVCRRDAHGQVYLDEMPLVGKTWTDLRTLEQHDVLAALGAQARSALFEFRKNRQLADDQTIFLDLRYYSSKMCEQARDTLRALTDPGGTSPWKLPECTHCAALAATALIDVQVRAIQATGVADPGTVLRMLLGDLEIPIQRKDHDEHDR